MPSVRAQVIQAHIRTLQAKLARAKTAEKPRVQLELDPGELERFREVTAAENERSARSSAP